jgi:putative restriction endonuclease
MSLNNTNNFINIEWHEFEILDTIEKITIADSFVVRDNKIWKWNWEAKLYVWQEWDELRTFFGEKPFNIKCFTLKKDFLRYLEEVKNEYIHPEQPYQNIGKLPELWNKRKEKIQNIGEILDFTLTEQSQIAPPRIYAKSNEVWYEFIRQLGLPNITYISIMKLQNITWSVLYYFRIFVDYFWELDHPIETRKEILEVEKSELSSEKKTQIIRARVWQWKYREELLKRCPYCPFTMVSDDRLLIASHIKPRAKANEKEKTDPMNGFMFTPTYDYLFDRWFISFTNDKRLLVSPWISKMTCSKLNLLHESKINTLPIDGREDYLSYHRDFIFKS